MRKLFIIAAFIVLALARAPAAAGQKELSIVNYEKSLGPNPRNADAAEALKEARRQMRRRT